MDQAYLWLQDLIVFQYLQQEQESAQRDRFWVKYLRKIWNGEEGEKVEKIFSHRRVTKRRFGSSFVMSLNNFIEGEYRP